MEGQKLYGSVMIKAVEILDFLRDSSEKPTASEIGEATQSTKSTISKILNTMLVLNLIEKDEQTLRYSIGTKMIGYGNRAIENYSFETQIEPYLEKIHDEIGQTIHIGVQREDEIIYIGKREAKTPVSLKSRVGDKVSMNTSAMGKAILAERTDEEIRKHLEICPLKRMTEHTIVDPEAFIKEIEMVRQTGVAFDREENELGIYCTGVAISSATHNYGAVSISVPVYYLKEEKKKRIIELLLEMKQGMLKAL
ncbi:MAG: IclR family transcriptional regulator [Streptococcaceae bacterium]|nr:IclR family transcriptional regulator [Streptococcaceae bacterium]